MKEAPGSSETSVLTRATRRNNPEDTILNTQFLNLHVRSSLFLLIFQQVINRKYVYTSSWNKQQQTQMDTSLRIVDRCPSYTQASHLMVLLVLKKPALQVEL
jgi:hypothetical protein